MVSITCCFIQREVKNEICLIILEFLNRFKCICPIKCQNLLNESLRNQVARNHQNYSTKKTNDANQVTFEMSTNSQIKYKGSSLNFSNKFFINSTSRINNRFQKACCCLFTNKRNDYFENESRRKSSTIFKDLKHRRRSARQRSLLHSDKSNDGSTNHKNIIFEEKANKQILTASKNVHPNLVQEKNQHLIKQNTNSKIFQESNDLNLKNCQSSFLNDKENAEFEPLLENAFYEKILEEKFESIQASNKIERENSSDTKTSLENLFEIVCDIKCSKDQELYKNNDTYKKTGSSDNKRKLEENSSTENIPNQLIESCFIEDESKTSLENLFLTLTEEKTAKNRYSTQSLHLDDFFKEIFDDANDVSKVTESQNLSSI